MKTLDEVCQGILRDLETGFIAQHSRRGEVRRAKHERELRQALTARKRAIRQR